MENIKIQQPGNDTMLSNKPKVIELTEEQYAALNKRMTISKTEGEKNGD